MPRPVPEPKGVDRRLARSTARLNAVQALYQMEMTGAPMPRVRAEFENHRLGMEIEEGRFREADLDLFRRILEDVIAGQAAIDQMTDRALVDRWPLNRIDSTLRALFRAAGAELLTPETPPKVVINEYVDIARAFWPEGKEPGMVNAVLDAMAREARPEAFRA